MGPSVLQHVLTDIDRLAGQSPPPDSEQLTQWTSRSGIHGALFQSLSEEGWPKARGQSDLARRLFPDLNDEDAGAELEQLVNLIARADTGIRLRVHLFMRNLRGMWACCDPSCEAVDERYRSEARRVGKLYSQPQFRCACGARILELLYCETCGELYLGGYRTESKDQPTLEYLVPTTTNLEMQIGRAHV